MLSSQYHRHSHDNVTYQHPHPPKNSHDNKNPSLQALTTAFLQALTAQGYSGSTIASYKQDLLSLGKWLKRQNLAILELSHEHLQRYKRFVYHTQQRQPATINRYLATMRRFYQWALHAGYCHQPPRLPKSLAQPTPCIRWLTRTQQRRLLNTLKQQQHARDTAAIVLLLQTGLRAAELCALQWHDVRMTQRSGSLRVRQAKGQRQRSVPLNALARDALHQLQYERHAGTQHALFQGQRGTLTPAGLQRIVAKYGTRAGIQPLSPHSLRHTFCKNLVDARVSLETIARLAGHAHIQTTRRYCEPDWQDLERAVTVMANKSIKA